VRLYIFFFFSSRRRHTRWPRDWSSDVCSSDLRVDTAVCREPLGAGVITRSVMTTIGSRPMIYRALGRTGLKVSAVAFGAGPVSEIGRASCRERVEVSGGAVAVKRNGRRG